MDQTINRDRLFLASCVALITTAMTFAIRARLETVFSNPDFAGLTLEQIGLAFGPAFYGFTLAMIIGGPLVDSLGIKKIAVGAFITHIIGIVITLFATDLWTLFTGTLFIGIGNGFVEAAFNPMIASLYPNKKTKMLNRFHVWFPGGIVIGSLVGYLVMDRMNLGWQVMVGCLFIPLIIYGVMIFSEKFPQTERVTMGISNSQMWKAIVTPLFLFMGFCMLLTAATELGTQQRIESLISESGAPGLLVLALTAGVMAVLRLFGGDIAHKLSVAGMLLFSAIFSAIGLYLLSISTGVMVYASAVVFALGVAFFWPMMLSFVAEYIPESGALGLSVMGGLGMFSVSLVLPVMGKMMDENTTGSEALQTMAILPIILTFLFAGLYFYMKNREATSPYKMADGTAVNETVVR